jgi:hypothetical protein
VLCALRSRWPPSSYAALNGALGSGLNQRIKKRAVRALRGARSKQVLSRVCRGVRQHAFQAARTLRRLG